MDTAALAAATSRSTLLVDVSGSSTSLALAQPEGPVTAVHSHLPSAQLPTGESVGISWQTVAPAATVP